MTIQRQPQTTHCECVINDVSSSSCLLNFALSFFTNKTIIAVLFTNLKQNYLGECSVSE